MLEGGDVPIAALAFRFQDPVDAGELWSGEYICKTGRPDESISDVVVSILVATEVGLAIVYMAEAEALQSDRAVELFEYPRRAVGGSEVVPRCECVTGIKADATESLNFDGGSYHVGIFLEGIAEYLPRSGGYFNE